MKSAFIFLIIISTFLMSCNEKAPSEKEVYVISKKDSIQDLTFKVYHNYYMKGNFILADNNKIFFYKNVPIWICSPSEDKRPVFINLNPDKIIQLPLNSIGEFVDLNFGGEKRQNYSISVASYTDSINSKAFEYLMTAFTKNRLPKFLIRRTTLEEETVIYHKVHNLPYLPDEVEWDTTRINFTYKEDVENILKKSQEKFKK